MLVSVAAGLCALACAAQSSPNWQAEIRQRVAARDLAAALGIAERRLTEAPQDMEARGWRARLLAWSGRWTEAETEYRGVLEAAPSDTDILVGLADVLNWQQRFAEALGVLDRAREVPPPRADVHTRRGKTLRAMGRRAEAREAFREALTLEPANREAKAGLDSVTDEPHHSLSVGSEFDFFSYTGEAQALWVNLRSQLSNRWGTNFTGSFHRRFGEDARKFTASTSYRASQRDTLTAGFAAAGDQGIIPKGEAFLEYGRSFPLSRQGLVRGVELGYRQHWLWFRAGRVLALGPNLLFYLPRDWMWSLQITAARSPFPGTAAEWRLSGLTRLRFPLHRRGTGNVFYGVGTENFALADQVGRFSARTWGGGARFEISPRQDVSFHALYQDRSRGRTQTSFGLGYGIRF